MMNRLILFVTLVLFTLQLQAEVALVTVSTAQYQEIYEDVELTGSVQARRLSRLSAEVDAKVEQLFVDAGDQVKKNQLLLKLRATPKQLELKQAKAQLHYQQSRLAELQSGSRPEEIAAQKADVESAKHALTLAQANEKRIAQLRQSQSIAQGEYDIAKTELNRAQANLAREQQEYELAVKGSRAEAIEAALAQVDSAQARVEQLEDQIARHEIRAPFAGVIGEKSTEVGSWVNTGEVVFTLVEIERLRVIFALPQVYYSRVTAATPVMIRFDALPQQTFTEVVEQKIPLGSSQARTFPVRVQFLNTEQNIAPGMSARVTLHLQRQGRAQALLVPRDAIVLNPSGQDVVWRVEPEEEHWIASSVKVETGQDYQHQVEIIQGALKVGDRVVVRGNETLTPGQKVKVIEYENRLDDAS